MEKDQMQENETFNDSYFKQCKILGQKESLMPKKDQTFFSLLKLAFSFSRIFLIGLFHKPTIAVWVLYLQLYYWIIYLLKEGLQYFIFLTLKIILFMGWKQKNDYN